MLSIVGLLYNILYIQLNASKTNAKTQYRRKKRVVALVLESQIEIEHKAEVNFIENVESAFWTTTQYQWKINCDCFAW